VPAVSLDPKVAAGAFALNLPDGQHAIWFRREAQRSVDWGGDPYNKAIAVSEGDEIRLSPRKSFDRWREIVRERSEPWTSSQTESAEALRRHLVESLYRRTRSALRMAETMQLTLLPDSIPTLENWQLSAHYEPAAGGRVGGDWYDAFELRDGRLVMVLGDVAGHGITAAGTMAQLRNALRAQLFVGTDPAEALHELNQFCEHMMPRAFATVVVARIDLTSGEVEAACAGHLIPYLTNSVTAVQAPIQLSPPVGLKNVTYTASAFSIQPGHRLVMYSDGLVERRGEAIDDGIDRLEKTLARAGDAPASGIRAAMEWGDTHDDVTIVTLRRP
jgi:serine phosphatase RsbU (regulator of sigma subunit)